MPHPIGWGGEGGFCLHFRFAETKVLPPSSWRQVTVQRIVVFQYSNPSLCIKIKPIQMDGFYFYGGEGGI